MVKLLIMAVMVWGIFLGCDRNPSNPVITQGQIKLMAGNANVLNLAKTDGVSPVFIDSAKVLISKIEIENANEDSMDFYSRMPIWVNVGFDTMNTVGIMGVPFGKYEEIEACIDSIYIYGKIMQNGNNYTFASRVSIEYEQEFDSPVMITADMPNIVLMLCFDSTIWFKDWLGSYLDPRVDANKNKITKNIRQSFYVDYDNDEDDDD